MESVVPPIGKEILLRLCIPVCPQKNFSLKDPVTLVAPSAQPKWLHVSPLKVPSALSCLCSLACLSPNHWPCSKESRKTKQLPGTKQWKVCAEVGDWLLVLFIFLATSSLKSCAGLFPSSSSHSVKDRVPYFNLAPFFCLILQIWVLFYHLT